MAKNKKRIRKTFTSNDGHIHTTPMYAKAWKWLGRKLAKGYQHVSTEEGRFYGQAEIIIVVARP